MKMNCLFSFFQESTVAAWYEQVRMEICVVQFVCVYLMFQLHLVHVCVFVNKEYISVNHIASSICLHPQKAIFNQLPRTTTYNSKYYYMYMYIFIHLFLCLCYQLVGGGEAFSITFFQLSLLTLLGYQPFEADIFIIYCVILNISCKMYQCLRPKTSELKDREKKKKDCSCLFD